MMQLKSWIIEANIDANLTRNNQGTLEVVNKTNLKIKLDTSYNSNSVYTQK